MMASAKTSVICCICGDGFKEISLLHFHQMSFHTSEELSFGILNLQSLDLKTIDPLSGRDEDVFARGGLAKYPHFLAGQNVMGYSSQTNLSIDKGKMNMQNGEHIGEKMENLVNPVNVAIGTQVADAPNVAAAESEPNQKKLSKRHLLTASKPKAELPVKRLLRNKQRVVYYNPPIKKIKNDNVSLIMMCSSDDAAETNMEQSCSMIDELEIVEVTVPHENATERVAKLCDVVSPGNESDNFIIASPVKAFHKNNVHYDEGLKDEGLEIVSLKPGLSRVMLDIGCNAICEVIDKSTQVELPYIEAPKESVGCSAICEMIDKSSQVDLSYIGGPKDATVFGCKAICKMIDKSSQVALPVPIESVEVGCSAICDMKDKSSQVQPTCDTKLSTPIRLLAAVRKPKTATQFPILHGALNVNPVGITALPTAEPESSKQPSLASTLQPMFESSAQSCLYCGQRFKKMYQLQHHMRLNHQNKIFTCPECGMNFKTQYYLKNHIILYHSKDEVFFCTKCTFRCTTREDLSTHFSKTHCLEMSKCDSCSKEYTSYNALCQHIRKEHSFLFCTACSTKFYTEGGLTEHQACCDI